MLQHIAVAMTCCGLVFRMLSGEELPPGEMVWYEEDEKKQTYTVTLVDDLTGRTGPITIKATNLGGSDEATAQMIVDGRAPEFVERPIKCVQMEGRCSLIHSSSRQIIG